LAEAQHKPGSDGTIVEIISDAESALSESAKTAKSISQQLARAKKSLASGKGVVDVVDSLLKSLGKSPRLPNLETPQDLSGRIRQALEQERRQKTASVLNGIVRAAPDRGLLVKMLADTIALGPFRLAVNEQRLLVSFRYARIPVGSEVPLEVDQVLEEAQLLRAQLLDSIPSGGELMPLWEEALRVAWIRRNPKIGSEIRVALPDLYKEVLILRQGFSYGGTPKSSQYSEARFIIETKTLLQSDQNLKSTTPIKPEAAVIENTKNRRKSMFLPNTIELGYGEGKYVQAVTQRQ
jgi:hypothetical protein